MCNVIILYMSNNVNILWTIVGIICWKNGKYVLSYNWVKCLRVTKKQLEDMVIQYQNTKDKRLLDDIAKGTIRISLGKNNTEEDVEAIVAALIKIVNKE